MLCQLFVFIPSAHFREIRAAFQVPGILRLDPICADWYCSSFERLIVLSYAACTVGEAQIGGTRGREYPTRGADRG